MPASNKKSKKAAVQNAAETPEIKSVAWPLLDPLCPKEDLRIHHLVPGQIVTISHFWTAALCKKYVNFLNGLPLTTTPGTPKRGEAVRMNDRYQIDDPEFAQSLWSSTGLKDLVQQVEREDENQGAKQNLWGGDAVGLNPNIRIYRYRKGQFFDQHYSATKDVGALALQNMEAASSSVFNDDSNNLTHPGPPSTPARTTWTLLLYLTSPTTGCIGGETVFYPDGPTSSATTNGGKKTAKNQEPPEPVVVGLETGMALLHRHGRECMLHEGREVTEGEKWVIRSDLCVRR